MTIVFGLAAAAAWGAGDFGGGLASRRVPVYGVVLVSQAAGGAMCLALALLLGETFATGKDLLVCVIAGLFGGVGITMLYRGLAIGRMGIVAPVTGVLAAVIPVVAGFVTQGIPPPPVVVGIVLAIVAVILVSRVAGESGGRDGLAEALVGGTAIGLFGVAIAQLLVRLLRRGADQLGANVDDEHPSGMEDAAPVGRPLQRSLSSRRPRGDAGRGRSAPRRRRAARGAPVQGTQ